MTNNQDEKVMNFLGKEIKVTEEEMLFLSESLKKTMSEEEEIHKEEQMLIQLERLLESIHNGLVNIREKFANSKTMIASAKSEFKRNDAAIREFVTEFHRLYTLFKQYGEMIKKYSGYHKTKAQKEIEKRSLYNSLINKHADLENTINYLTNTMFVGHFDVTILDINKLVEMFKKKFNL